MKKVVVTIFMVLVSLLALAQEGNGIFWKVTGNGLQKPSYILGSHHLAPASFVDSIAGLRAAIGSVDVMYGEVSKSELTDVSAQQRLMASWLAPADSTLSKVLSPADLAKVDSLFASIVGMPGMAAHFETYKPVVASTQLEAMIAVKAFPTLNLQESFDMALFALGEAAGKPICGLETVDDQAKLLFGNPIAKQAETLMDEVNHVDSIVIQTKELTKGYFAQDLAAVTRSVTDPAYGVKEYDLERMINRRNRNWVAQLDGGLMQKQSVFVVVGCGHLGGDKGVLRLLSQKGYTVECVK